MKNPRQSGVSSQASYGIGYDDGLAATHDPGPRFPYFARIPTSTYYHLVLSHTTIGPETLAATACGIVHEVSDVDRYPTIALTCQKCDKVAEKLMRDI